MNKNSARIKEKINKINKLLIAYFGIPARPKKLPNPVDTLIATILSQNTNDRNSYQAYRNLKKKYGTLDELANSPRSEIEKVIRVAGLGRQKSASIKNFLTKLKKKNGRLNLQYIKKMRDDDILNELTSIKGIGVKTASCVLLFSLDRNVCPVDTHVHRTLNRIGIVKTTSPEKTFIQINKYMPDGIAHQFHTNLINLGREICKPSNPKCSICPLLKECKFKGKNLEKVVTVNSNRFLLLDSI
jgi:endonuclease III